MKTSVLLHVLATILALGAPLAAAQTPSHDLLKKVVDDPQAVKTAAQAGASVADFCNNCHGPGGNSRQSDVPNLAGQNPVFMLGRVQRYASGQRGDEFMQKLVRLFTPSDRVNLALYYANQRPLYQRPSNPMLAQRGKPVYDRLCEDCHGADGAGDEELGRIAGQQEAYLALALARYRSGEERVDDKFARRMVKVMRTLSEDEVRALVAYVSGLR